MTESISKTYQFRGFYIPERMMYGLLGYIEKGYEVGDFLTAVLCNDLKGACDRADEENMQNLPAYIGYLYNEAPLGCWGSKENMKQWKAKKREERKAEEELNVGKEN